MASRKCDKLIERFGPPAAYGDPAAVLRRSCAGTRHAECGAGCFYGEPAPRRFFAGLAETGSTFEALQRRMADHCKDIVAVATDTLVTGAWISSAIACSRSATRSIGIAIRSRTGGAAGALEHARPSGPRSVGDSKVVWELNRHQWVVRLAQAWALTRDERYAEACMATIDSWLDANPPGLGINWASSLEVSYRLISWCWALLLIRNCADADRRMGDEGSGGDLAHASRMSGVISRTTSHLTPI